MIEFFTKHPTAANLLMVIFLAMGLLSLSSLRRETLPDFAADQAQVSVLYPGATAEEVEEAICQRIEDVIDGISYVAEVRSEALEGRGTVLIEMREGGDFSAFIADIKREVEAIDDFPDQAEEPLVIELGDTDHVVSVGVTGPMALPDLKAYCEDVKTRLKRETGLSLVKIHGFSEHQIRIQVPALTLMQFGMALTDIASMIASQSVDVPSGTITTAEQEILLRFNDERHTPEEFANLVVVTSKDGAQIRLGDIATIADVFERDEEQVVVDGRRAGLLEIQKTKTEDALKILDAVKAFLAREEERKPPQVQFSLTYDMASVVRDRLLLLVKNGWQGFVLVFLTLWLFLNIRFSFWVAMGLPVSFLGAFFFVPRIDYSLNMITMVGLLIALGLLMDDAIVIAENIATHLHRGASPLHAVIQGVNEVKAGVLSSFLTTVCVFGPLAFLTGQIGKVLRVMPVMLILVLSVSLVEAFCILPHHLAHSLTSAQGKQPGRFRRRFERMIVWLREAVVGRLVDITVRWRYLTFGVTIAIFIVSIGMLASGQVKFQAFPDLDGDILEVRVLLPQGTPLERTEGIVTRLTEALDLVDQEFTPLQPNGQHLVQNVIVQYNKNTSAYEQGPHVVTLNVDLLSAETRKARIDDIFNRWRKLVGTIPDVMALTFTEPLLPVAGLPIELHLFSDDLALAKQGALEMQSWLASFQGVFDLMDDLRPGKPEVRFRLGEDAAVLGLTAQQIATQLRTAYYGMTVSEIQAGVESYEIDVQLDDADQNSLADLDYFHLTLPNGVQVPLSAALQRQTDRGYARIARIDGQRAVTIQGDVDANLANVAEIMSRFRQDFLPQFAQKYPGIWVSIAGESEESQTTGASLRRGFLVGILGIFVLLSFQFRSYLEPLIVMVAIPFALIGVIWGHLAMGLQLCMPSMMGFVSLAGIVVNDSILLVEFIKLQRRKGLTIADAARQASRQRFRAVMLTSLTTIAGLLPLLAEKSLQAQILIPLAVSIAFGLMASTLLVLLVLPAIYAIVGDLGL